MSDNTDSEEAQILDRLALLEGKLGALEIMVAVLLDEPTRSPAQVRSVADALRRAAKTAKQANEN